MKHPEVNDYIRINLSRGGFAEGRVTWIGSTQGTIMDEQGVQHYFFFKDGWTLT